MSLKPKGLTTLVTYSRLFGRRWKHKLYTSWLTGNYDGVNPEYAAILQRLRNASDFGPEGLSNFRVPKETE